MLRIILASALLTIGFLLAFRKIRHFKQDPESEKIESMFDFISFFPVGFLYPIVLILIGGVWLFYLLAENI